MLKSKFNFHVLSTVISKKRIAAFLKLQRLRNPFANGNRKQESRNPIPKGFLLGWRLVGMTKGVITPFVCAPGLLLRT